MELTFPATEAGLIGRVVVYLADTCDFVSNAHLGLIETIKQFISAVSIHLSCSCYQFSKEKKLIYEKQQQQFRSNVTCFLHISKKSLLRKRIWRLERQSVAHFYYIISLYKYSSFVHHYFTLPQHLVDGAYFWTIQLHFRLDSQQACINPEKLNSLKFRGIGFLKRKKIGTFSN